MVNANVKKVVLSRTDSIGDVMLSLPVAGYLREKIPGVKIYFIGKSYTAPVIKACQHVDIFLNRDELLDNPSLLREIDADVIVHLFPDKAIAALAYSSKIPQRIGTSHRLMHWLYCNKLVNLSRKKSPLHESILNLQLLRPIFPHISVDLSDVASMYGIKPVETIPHGTIPAYATNKIKIILHPKSKGSAREWPLENYAALVKILPADKYVFFITGTLDEGRLMHEEVPILFSLPYVIDLTGKLSLGELISFINHCDGLVACSTGPLHISAALGKPTIGLYPPMRPIHPGRWAAVGKKVKILVLDKNCTDCRNGEKCFCISSIAAGQVARELLSFYE